eukprot:2482247-Pyramimonas_sp.AAC.1
MLNLATVLDTYPLACMTLRLDSTGRRRGHVGLFEQEASTGDVALAAGLGLHGLRGTPGAGPR